MAIFRKRMDYRAKYPDASEAVIETLEKSDRKMEYQQYDLKAERWCVDSERLTVTYIPSREDSYERLTEENMQFADKAERVEDTAVKTVLIEKMLSCLKLLTPEEQELIAELFFKEKSEHQLFRETGIPQKTIHNRKVRILKKLKNFIEK